MLADIRYRCIIGVVSSKDLDVDVRSKDPGLFLRGGGGFHVHRKRTLWWRAFWWVWNILPRERYGGWEKFVKYRCKNGEFSGYFD